MKGPSVAQDTSALLETARQLNEVRRKTLAAYNKAIDDLNAVLDALDAKAQ